MAIPLRGAKQGIDVRLGWLGNTQRLGWATQFLNKPLELRWRRDLKPPARTIGGHDERMWYTPRQHHEGPGAAFPPIIATHNPHGTFEDVEALILPVVDVEGRAEAARRCKLDQGEGVVRVVTKPAFTVMIVSRNHTAFPSPSPRW